MRALLALLCGASLLGLTACPLAMDDDYVVDEPSSTGEDQGDARSDGADRVADAAATDTTSCGKPCGKACEVLCGLGDTCESKKDCMDDAICKKGDNDAKVCSLDDPS